MTCEDASLAPVDFLCLGWCGTGGVWCLTHCHGCPGHEMPGHSDQGHVNGLVNGQPWDELREVQQWSANTSHHHGIYRGIAQWWGTPRCGDTDCLTLKWDIKVFRQSRDTMRLTSSAMSKCLSVAHNPTVHCIQCVTHVWVGLLPVWSSLSSATFMFSHNALSWTIYQHGSNTKPS